MILDPDTACALIFKIRRLHGKEAAGPDVLASNDVDEGQPAGASMDDALAEFVAELDLNRTAVGIIAVLIRLLNIN